MCVSSIHYLPEEYLYNVNISTKNLNLKLYIF